MRTKLLRPVLVAVLTLATACAAPEAGDDCNQENAGTCDSNTAALFCQSGTLRAVQCRGPAGCNEGSAGVVCDITRAQAGDTCLAANADQAQCDVSNPSRALVCRSGTWTAQACNSCASQGGQIVCQP